MKALIAGGTGFIGQFLIPALLKDNHQVVVLGRDTNKIQKTFHDKVTALTWDTLSSESLRDVDAIINLAGTNIGEKRWSTSVKDSVKTSRFNTTKKLVDCCLSLNEKKPRMLNASAIGIYGLHEHQPQQPQPVDESWEIPWGKPTDFSSEITQAWENTLQPAIDHGMHVAKMRFGVVLHPKFGALKKLMPSIKLGMASVIGNGKQGVSWIMIDDLIRAILFLLEHPEISGPINCTSPNPISQKTFIKALARAAHRPCFLKTPAWVIKFLFGQMGDELIIKGQRVIPTKLLEHGFKFRYETIDGVGFEK
ncbi:MAG: TIGR01777 family oxidoreductase [Gammaproteobacteria bacterium]